MRRRSAYLAVIFTLAYALSAGTAGAQSRRPFDVAVSGGTTMLAGEDRDFYDVGRNGQLSALFPLRAAGFTLRADASYLGVPGKNKSTQTYPGGPDTLLVGDLAVMAGALGAQFAGGGATRAVRPYATFGAGVYRVESKGLLYGQDVSGADTKFGVVGGVGLTFPVAGLRAFAEARLHNVFAEDGSARIYPISTGFLL